MVATHQEKQDYKTDIDEKELILRNLSPFWNHFVLYTGALASLFILYVNIFSSLRELWLNSFTWSILALMGFILYPPFRMGKDKIKFALDLLFALAAVSITLYLVFFEDNLHARNEEMVLSDFIFAAIAIVLTIELARRTTGWVIPILAVLFILYAMWLGNFFPGVFHFAGLSWERLLYRMYFTDEGLFGSIATISSTFVYMFIIFAAFLIRSGAGDFIIRMAQVLTGKITGGPGLVAVLSSGLMGTISGSAISNVVSTGSITIPMMKKAGFEPKFAAGVETAASTGGQIMPPIMGAGAFIMAEYTNIPYGTIVLVAFLPGILYFFSVGVYVYLVARKKNIMPATADSSSGQETLNLAFWMEGLQFIIPIIILIALLIWGFTPTYAAGVSIVSIVVFSWMSKSNRMGYKAVLEALSLGTRNMITTGVLLVTVGIVVGIISMTSLSLTFAQMITQWSGGNLLIALALITIASLFLGMGLPVTAAYIILAILAAPALTKMGVSLLVAHLIIFWVSQDSNVTPPVCLAAFAGAGIAGSRPMATGVTAWNLAKGLYIIPLLMAYTNLVDGSWPERIEEFLFAAAGFVAFASVMVGYFEKKLNVSERALMGAVTFFLFMQVIWTQLAALLLLIFLFFLYRYQRKQRQTST